MSKVIFLLFYSIRQSFRTRAALQAEILALRHQLLVLQRSTRSHRLHLGTADRALWVWLSRLWNGWRSALIIVKPETVIAGHRRGFQLFWRWKSRPRVGRPSISQEVIDLIRRMSVANPRWGAPGRAEKFVHQRTASNQPATQNIRPVDIPQVFHHTPMGIPQEFQWPGENQKFFRALST